MNIDSVEVDNHTTTASLWINDHSNNCIFTGIIVNYTSPFFIPHITNITEGSGDVSVSEENGMHLTFTGRCFIPCDLRYQLRIDSSQGVDDLDVVNESTAFAYLSHELLPYYTSASLITLSIIYHTNQYTVPYTLRNVTHNTRSSSHSNLSLLLLVILLPVVLLLMIGVVSIVCYACFAYKKQKRKEEEMEEHSVLKEEERKEDGTYADDEPIQIPFTLIHIPDGVEEEEERYGAFTHHHRVHNSSFISQADILSHLPSVPPHTTTHSLLVIPSPLLSSFSLLSHPRSIHSITTRYSSVGIGDWSECM